jgi:hypothetical protein
MIFYSTQVRNTQQSATPPILVEHFPDVDFDCFIHNSISVFLDHFHFISLKYSD